MKTQLTKDDPSGWYVAQYPDNYHNSAIYWDGAKTYLAQSPDGDGINWSVGWKNFRRLVEAEVIEGSAQKVGVGQQGRWIEESSSGSMAIVWMEIGDNFVSGYRYMRPAFPPRPRPNPDPPKPELVLVQYNGHKYWAMRDGSLFRLLDGGSVVISAVEVQA